MGTARLKKARDMDENNIFAFVKSQNLILEVSSYCPKNVKFRFFSQKKDCRRGLILLIFFYRGGHIVKKILEDQKRAHLYGK